MSTRSSSYGEKGKIQTSKGRYHLFYGLLKYTKRKGKKSKETLKHGFSLVYNFSTSFLDYKDGDCFNLKELKKRLENVA